MSHHGNDHVQGVPREDLVDHLAERVGSRAAAAAVFGDPVSRGDHTVIPVARTAFGFGGGSGEGTDGDGSGSGGGGGAMVRPVGFIQLDADGARFTPIRDPLKLMGLATVGLLIVARSVVLLARGRR